MKFEKITRPASEFIILSILAEKDNLHPYEIMSILEKQVLKKHQERISEIAGIVDIGDKIIDHFDNPTKFNDNDLTKIVESYNEPLLKFLIIELINKIKKNKDVLMELKELNKDAKNMLINIGAELKTWDTIPAIYQVINDLEKEKLIKVAGTETYKGRTRKLYTITPKGRLEALQMLTLFGELTQVISPHLINFQDTVNFFFQQHIKIFFKIVEQIYPNESVIDSIFKIEEKYPYFQKVLQGAFPLLDNDTLLIAFLSNNFDSIKSINLERLNSNEQKLFKHLLINRLNDYRVRIDELIKNLS